MKKLWKWMGTAAVIIASLCFLQRLLMPKYAADVVEGALIAEYYGEEKDHDVIFIGDCEVYENFSPAVLWLDYGINSYIRGSAQQLIWQSYYLLEDTLRYEKPRAVIFNVLAMQYNEPQREAYNRMTLEGMRWSLSKAAAIRASMTEEEHFLEYVFPLLRYHSRWSELGKADVAYLLDTPKVSHNGYYMRVDARPAENVPEGRPLGDYTIDAGQMEWLENIRLLCEQNGVELVLIKAPSLYPYWYDQWEEQIADYAEDHGLLYVNLLALHTAAGLDYQTDTYDGGLHLNLAGAEKLSRYFGEILQDKCGLKDRRGEMDLVERWLENEKWYQEDRERQEKELTADDSPR